MGLFITKKHTIMSMYKDFYEPEPPIDTCNLTIWITRDGQRIPVKDMTDSHLINTIKLLNKKVSREDWFNVLNKELKRRGLQSISKNPLYYCDATECDIY